MSLRSHLAVVRGLGSAKSGTHHWWMQRLTALALIPLSVWFMVALLCRIDAPHGEVLAWIGSPLVATLLISLLLALFYHAQLGMQVVFEDYIHHEAVKLTAQVLLTFTVFIVGLAAVLAVLKISLGS